MAEVKELPRPASPQVELDVEERIELGVGWILDHRKHILNLVLLGSLIWVGVLAYRNWHTGRMEKANDLFYTAELAYQEAISKTVFGTSERASKMAEVREKSQKVRDEFPKTAVARAAILLQGDSFYFAGDPVGSAANTGEAIRLYEEFLREAQTPEEKALGSLALGYANENRLFLTGDSQYFTPAIDAYEQARQNAGNTFLRYEAMNALARLYAYVRQTDKAIELYREVYKARYRPVDPPEDGANNMNAMMFSMLKERMRAFTVGSTARASLQGLGVDVEALEREADSGK